MKTSTKLVLKPMNKIALKKLIIALKTPPVDIIPAGWMCRQDIEKKYDMSFASASRYIKYIQDHKPSKIKMKKFKVMSSTGAVYPKPYYLISK